MNIPLTEKQATLVRITAEAEEHLCVTCPQYKRAGGPRHFSGFLANQTFYNNGCESYGRQLQSDLTFTGHSHCTCDTCF